MNLTSVDGDGDCEYALLVDEDSYIKGRLSIDAHNVSVPVTLMWTLTSNDTPYCCQRAYLVNLELDMGNGTSMESRGCFLDGRYEGNPYLYNGCEDREECARCPYSCDYMIMYLVHGLIRFSNLTCSQNPVWYESKSSSLGITLGNI
ncbi:hypothetical protein HanPI659440_Chr14g0557611 [Helianthus annuus]|nr:hypothetical protein HanLR1_Chr14g0538691 [Helianthus annuus]KAJ0660282.1 hypothetical protein HanOQP8_Chr14g0536071 [Helianthus annuus]KAJ0703985.1 hypothetical protein HanPI659440_Chr14g0557611 [Helianthus annuus]KAJ0840792.1 hypothetical protein HanPSC8_Chr14g0623051 [Helianthus annuus]